MATRLEVKCVRKTDRNNAHERIRAVGGSAPGRVWQHSQQLAMSAIEAGSSKYFMNIGGHRVDLIVAVSQAGYKYLKTATDGEQPDNLLRLPECP